ncbi:hypothetical protein [Vibrio phage vB_pir03]|nr:hypothetical protein [Vibrio phage vB_pir03]
MLKQYHNSQTAQNISKVMSVPLVDAILMEHIMLTRDCTFEDFCNMMLTSHPVGFLHEIKGGIMRINPCGPTMNVVKRYLDAGNGQFKIEEAMVHTEIATELADIIPKATKKRPHLVRYYNKSNFQLTGEELTNKKLKTTREFDYENNSSTTSSKHEFLDNHTNYEQVFAKSADGTAPCRKTGLGHGRLKNIGSYTLVKQSENMSTVQMATLYETVNDVLTVEEGKRLTVWKPNTGIVEIQDEDFTLVRKDQQNGNIIEMSYVTKDIGGCRIMRTEFEYHDDRVIAIAVSGLARIPREYVFRK